MSLSLPDFKDRACIEVSFCAKVVTEERAAIPAIEEIKQNMISSYEKSGRKVYFALIKNFPGENMHIHLDLVTSERFEKAPSSTNCSPENIFRLIEPFFGKTLELSLRGMSIVLKEKLPHFIRAVVVPTIADGVEVRMTAGILAVRGAPVQYIAWELTKRGAEITLGAKQKTKLEPSYLEAGLEILESAFRALIFKES